MSEGIATIIGMIIACAVRVVGSMNSERGRAVFCLSALKTNFDGSL